jgi:hypothetical protein
MSLKTENSRCQIASGLYGPLDGIRYKNDSAVIKGRKSSACSTTFVKVAIATQGVKLQFK